MTYYINFCNFCAKKCGFKKIIHFLCESLWSTQSHPSGVCSSLSTGCNLLTSWPSRQPGWSGIASRTIGGGMLLELKKLRGASCTREVLWRSPGGRSSRWRAPHLCLPTSTEVGCCPLFHIHIFLVLMVHISASSLI